MQVEPKMRALEDEAKRREIERRKVDNSLGLGSRMPQQRTATTLSNARGTVNVPLPEITSDDVQPVPESPEISDESVKNEPTEGYLVKYEVKYEVNEPPSPTLSEASTVLADHPSRRNTRRETRKRPHRVMDDAPIEHAAESGWIEDTESQQQHYINTAAAVTTWSDSGGAEKLLMREHLLPTKTSNLPSPKKRRYSSPRNSPSPSPKKRCHVTSDEPSAPSSKKRCELPPEKLIASSPKKPSTSSPKKSSTSSPKKSSTSSPKKPMTSSPKQSHSLPTKASSAEATLNSSAVKNPFGEQRNVRSPRKQKPGSMKNFNTSEHSADRIYLNDSTDRSSDDMLISRVPSILEEANDEDFMSDDNETEHAVNKNSSNFEDDSHWNLPGTSSGVNRSRTVPPSHIHDDSMSEAEYREKRKAAKSKKDAILARVDNNAENSKSHKLVDERSKKSPKKVEDKTNSLKNWRNENARVDRVHDISLESSDDEPTYSYIKGTQLAKKTTRTPPNDIQNGEKVNESRQEKNKINQKQIIERPDQKKDSNTKSSKVRYFIPDHPLVRRFGLRADFLPERPETAWTRLKTIAAKRLKESEKEKLHQQNRTHESSLSTKTKRPVEKSPVRKVHVENNHGKVTKLVSSSDDDNNRGNNDSGNEKRLSKKSKSRMVKNPWCKDNVQDKRYEIYSTSEDDNNDGENNSGSNESRSSKKTKRPMEKNSVCNGNIQSKRQHPYQIDSSSDDDRNDGKNNTGSKFLKQFYHQKKAKLPVVKSKPTEMSEKNGEDAKRTKTKNAGTRSKHFQSRESNDEGEEDDVIVLSDESFEESTPAPKRLSDQKKSNNEKSRNNRHAEDQRKVHSRSSFSDNDSDDEVVLKTNQPDKSKRSSTDSRSPKSPNKSEVPKKRPNLFTDFENEQIIMYLINTNEIWRAKGMEIFKEMSRDKNLRHRSVESLSDQFHDVILPNIDEFARKFKLSSITVREFKEFFDS